MRCPRLHSWKERSGQLYFLWRKIDQLKDTNEKLHITNLLARIEDKKASHILNEAHKSIEYFCERRPIQRMDKRTIGHQSYGEEKNLSKWVRRIKDEFGVQSIIHLISPKEIRHYVQLDLGAEDLIDLYRKNFEVRHIPWEDPAAQPARSSETSRFKEELARIKVDALRAFDELPKPVLLHCSAGIDRSSPVAAHIWVERAAAYT